ncbi:MAG TPA: dihydroneopterin aldolase [Leucothrix mucor]|uniref:Bifunctional folate synthesis protein n=1 Tax=Leucothrix mucor TaxID=45248 RepID=A0A7V2WUP3_LEUMU|nr:dihydroneopterin aldolase [Leucothrix mucor]
MNTDIVYVRDLQVAALIGIYDWERQIRQMINIDLEMGWDNRKAAASDDIKHTLNYKAASKMVVELVKNSEYQLVETLAERIAALLLEKMQIPWVKVTLGKPKAVSGSREVGVIITRKRKAQVYLDIGSNIDRKRNIHSCMQQLRLEFPDVVFSRAYESEAAGFEGDSFINLSASLQTDKSYQEMLRYLKRLETDHARQRSGVKFSSRTLDVDILFYNDLILQPEIDLPRAEVTKYPFVLYPLAEIAADFIHPELGLSIAELAKKSKLDQNILQEIKLY